MARDFYEVLGVGKNADQSEIQRAYRKLARQHHPDVNKDPSAEARFKEISEAYDVLSDPEQRKRYDAFGEDFRRVPPDVSPEEWRRAQAYAGAGAGAGAGGPWPRGNPGSGGVRFTDVEGDIDLEDLLGGIFGGRGRTARGPMPGSDQEFEAEITVEEAYHGTQRSLTITGPDGQRTLDVNIPAGVVDGQRIRLRGQGGRGTGGAEPGDLYLIIRIAPHPRYRVSGRDLSATLPLSPWEAALGRNRPGRYSRRPRNRQRAARHVERPPAAPEGSWAAEPPRRTRGLLRRGSDPGAIVSVTGRKTALRGAPRALHLRSEAAVMTIERRYALARPFLLSLDSYARLTGVHPDLVRRLTTLGLLEITRDAQGGLWFEPSQISAMARIQRLHRELNLNYASLGLIIDLLDRIAQLERLQRRHAARGGDRWT